MTVDDDIEIYDAAEVLPDLIRAAAEGNGEALAVLEAVYAAEKRAVVN